MRQKLVVVSAALLLLLVMAIPAAAIVWGEPDGNDHPYVGLVVFYDEEGTPLWRCSGTLLSPTVFLTAGHCTFGTASAQVWFDAEVELESGYPFTGGVTGTPYAHPDYDNFATFPNTSDVGVVVLDEPVEKDTYGTLPEIGALDELYSPPGPPPVLEIVGYGLQSVKPTLMADRVRYQGNVMLVELNSALTGGYNLHVSSNAGEGQGRGGACFGDSGGPAFIEEGSNVVVGVGSFVLNLNCVGAGFYYRVDTQHAQTFITSFL